jgi:RNA polymerase sigma-70 factor, ECF subfamily
MVSATWTGTQQLDDASWVARLKSGDEGVFSAVYRQHSGPLYRFALRMCGSEALAEDAVQESFMALLKPAAQGYDPSRGALSSYLYGIVRRQVYRQLGSIPDVEPLDEAASTVETDVDPLDGLSRREQVEQVRLALQVLPAHYREVIVLCDLEEMSYADAAERLGCVVGTVRSRLSRARTLLWQRLQRVRCSK